MKIFITLCDPGPDAWTTYERKLRRLYQLNDKKYSLTDRPEAADIILVGNVREENWAERMGAATPNDRAN